MTSTTSSTKLNQAQPSSTKLYQAQPSSHYSQGPAWVRDLIINIDDVKESFLSIVGMELMWLWPTHHRASLISGLVV